MKNLFWIGISLVSILFAKLPAQTIIWEKTYGGNNLDQGLDIIPQNNNFLLGGNSESLISGDRTSPGRGASDIWILTLDSSGNLLSDQAFGGSGQDFLEKSIALSPNNYFFPGSSGSPPSGDKSSIQRGTLDYWLISSDSTLNISWERAYGGNGVQNLEDGIISQDQSLILFGESSALQGFEKSQNRIGGIDFWVIKVDSNGNKVWDSTLGGSGTEEAVSVIPTQDGGFLLGGNTESPAGFNVTVGSRGLTDYWIVKIDSLGNYLWDKTYGGSADDVLSTIIPTQDGNFILSGQSNSPVGGDRTAASRGLNDFWIIKIGPQGNKIWDKAYGGTSIDFALHTLETPDQGLLISGISDSPISGEKSEPSRGGPDFWVLRLDQNGNYLWDKTIGGSGADILVKSLMVTPNTFLLAGFSDSNISGDKSQNSRGAEDYWLVKIADTTVAPPPDTISGTLFADSPINCAPDPGEIPVPYRLVRANDGTQDFYTLANAQGQYQFLVPAGTYTITLVTNTNTQLSPACPVAFSHTATLTGGSHVQNRDFFLAQACDINLAIAGFPAPGERSFCPPNPQSTPCIGRRWKYCFTLTNSGTSPFVSGSAFSFSVATGRTWTNPLTIQDPCGLNPTFIPNSGQGILFLSQPFPPGQTCRFCAEVDVLGPAPALTWNSSITAISGLSNCVAGNIGGSNQRLQEAINCACDPNDLQVSPLGCGVNHNIPMNTGSITYTIRFQNLGTGPAQEVVILDTLDAAYDPETIQLKDAIGLTRLDILPGNILRAAFEGINLPPALVDSVASQGSFQFSLQLLPGQTDGTVIQNRAAIYFDQNVPVITNTVTQTLRTQPTPQIDLGPDQVVFWGYTPAECTSLSPTANGRSPFNYTWSDGSSQSSLAVCPKQNSQYSVIVKDAEGCASTDTLQVEVVDVHCGPRNSEVSLCLSGREYCVRQSDVQGYLNNGAQLGPCSTQKQIITSEIEGEVQLTVYPNPFTDQTQISFQVPEAGKIKIEVLSLQGQVLAELHDAFAEPGEAYSFSFSGHTVSPGLYLLRLMSEEGIEVRKIFRVE